jgi:hypothetical protein
MKYRGGYNYQLAETIGFSDTNITPPETVKTKFITLQKDGVLWIKEGYAWDGSSGARDKGIILASTMTASLAHDALYQLMRMELIGQGWKTDADILLVRLLDVCMRAAIALQIELTEKLSKVKPAKVVGGCQQWKKPDVQTKEAPPKRGLL